MCGVQCRPTCHETWKRHAGLDSNLLIHLSFRQGADWKCCFLLCKKPLYKIKCIIIPILFLQRIRQIMLPSAYWLLSLSKLVSKYNTAPLRHTKSSLPNSLFKDVHILCSCRKQSLSYCWLHMIYNWANNSLTSKGYEQNVNTGLHAPLALISKQVHLLMTAHAINTVQFKVNGTDPYMAMVYLHIGLLQL